MYSDQACGPKQIAASIIIERIIVSLNYQLNGANVSEPSSTRGLESVHEYSLTILPALNAFNIIYRNDNLQTIVQMGNICSLWQNLSNLKIIIKKTLT